MEAKRKKVIVISAYLNGTCADSATILEHYTDKSVYGYV